MSKLQLYLVAFALLLCVLTPYLCPSFPFLCQIPMFFAMTKHINGERAIDGCLCGVVYCGYYSVIMYPISFVLHIIPYHWCLLFTYSVFLFAYNRELINLDLETISDNFLWRIWLSMFWNAPLLISFKLVAKLGGQLCAPLASIIDKNICVGALPCNERNALQLYDAPYNVRAIINLCDEAMGPIETYKKCDMKYIRLRTLDTTPPSIENANIGIGFIKEFVKLKKENDDDNGRVFIHCKGGIGRSVTMAVCWYISQGVDAKTAIKMIKSKRRVASSHVLTYQTVKHFIKKG